MIDVVVKKSSGFIPKTVTMDQAKDTGMAMTLIALLIGYFGHKPYGIAAAIALLLADMTWPALYRPVARLWFGLSHVLGTVMSKVLLSILFFCVSHAHGLRTKVVRQRFTAAEKMEKRPFVGIQGAQPYLYLRRHTTSVLREMRWTF